MSAMAQPNLTRRRSINITSDEPTIVSVPDGESYAVYALTVHDPLRQKKYRVVKRLDEFDELRSQMIKILPEVARLPFPKRTLTRSNSIKTEVIVKRSEGLQSWLKAVIDMAGSNEESVAAFLGSSESLSPRPQRSNSSVEIEMIQTRTKQLMEDDVDADPPSSSTTPENKSLPVDAKPPPKSDPEPSPIPEQAPPSHRQQPQSPLSQTPTSPAVLRSSATIATETEDTDVFDLTAVPATLKKQGSSFLDLDHVGEVRTDISPEERKMIRRQSSKTLDGWLKWEKYKMAEEYALLAKYLPPAAVERIKKEDMENLRVKLLKKQASESFDAWRELRKTELEKDYDKIDAYYSEAAAAKIKEKDAADIHGELVRRQSSRRSSSFLGSFSRGASFQF